MNVLKPTLSRAKLTAPWFTTLRKLWVGFGTLTALIIVVCVVVLVGVGAIEGLVQEQSNIARPRSAAARELELNLLGYTLGARMLILTEDPKFRAEAEEDAAHVDRHLADYERLAITDQQRELASRFGTIWREYKGLVTQVMNSKVRPMERATSEHLADLRIGIEKFLDSELQANATLSQSISREATLQEVHTIRRLALVMLVVGGIFAIAMSVAVSRAIVRSEWTAAERAELLRTTLASIGDGAIATDRQGRITSMNGVAESLTGWTSADALGQPNDTVFHIVSEGTRQPVENPTTKALREGIVVGPANHTILIAKDGTERFIDHNAAPIRSTETAICGGVLVFRDITSRKQAEEALTAQQRLHKSVTDNASVAQFIMDDKQQCSFMNPAAEQLTGYTLQETRGRALHDIVQHSHSDGSPYPLSECPIDQAFPRQSNMKGEEVFVHKAGHFYYVAFTASPLHDACGMPVGTIIEVQDITERKRMESSLRDADRRKDEFLATLAHELRNPLAPVRAAVELLRLKIPDDPDLQCARDVIDRQIKTMTRLIDDLMDVSRINQGKIELRRERVELAKIIRGAIETSRPLIESMGHELTVTLPPGNLIVDADPIRLAQVFMNLLNNAAKYTERGGRIDLQAQMQGSDVVVSVKDTGVGIPADKLPLIFEIFSQVQGALSRSQGGLGIGLSLVKRLVELHGGSVEAKSGPGKGCEFLVRLPIIVEQTYLRKVSNAADSGGEKAAPTSDLRVLVVDDNLDAAATLAMLLKMMGNTVYTAHDGEEAVAAAKEFRPHVVLCDIGLPKLNGYEACRQMKQQAWDQKMIFIAVTGWGQDADRRKAKEAGFDHHLVKPADPQALMNLLASLGNVKV